MTRKAITEMYQQFRKDNNNRKPNRVVVRMHWEDESEISLVDTLAIVPAWKIGWETEPDDAFILYYVSSLKGIVALTKPDNGSDFVIDEVCEFYEVL